MDYKKLFDLSGRAVIVTGGCRKIMQPRKTDMPDVRAELFHVPEHTRAIHENILYAVIMSLIFPGLGSLFQSARSIAG